MTQLERAADHSTLELLERFRNGDRGAAESLFSIFYEELRRLAALHMRAESVGHTLQPTALVNELYFKIIHQKALSPDSEDQGERLRTKDDFFRLARYLMAQILIEYGRAKRSTKRKHIKAELDEARAVQIDSDESLKEVLAALDRLEMQDPELRRIVDLRFFCGYSIVETARLLGVGQTKVKADWRVAKLWLQRELCLLEGIFEGKDEPST